MTARSASQSAISRLAAFATFVDALWQKFVKRTTTLFLRVWTLCFEACWGTKVEKEKLVLRGGLWPAFAKCFVHVLPIFGCIVVSFLNFRGYFIGSTLQGITNPAAQSVYRLGLQVAAKIYELLAVASLGTIIMDVVRYHLLFGAEGLPLGLVFAKLRFADLAYIVSQDCLAGCSGFSKKRNRRGFLILLTSCSAIAVLIGPSVALLIIPTHYESWPAGGVSFWLNGDLSPPSLDSNLAQYQGCALDNSNRSLIYAPNTSLAHCPWAGFSNVQSELEQRAYSADTWYTYGAGSVRQYLWFTSGASTEEAWFDAVRFWGIASNLAIGIVARYIAQGEWCRALYYAPQTRPGGADSNFPVRDPYDTRALVHGVKVPLVRTQCFIASNYAYDGNDIDTSSDDTMMPFPIIPDYSGRRDLRYYISVPQHNASRTNSYWVPIPSGSSPTSYGASIDLYPSAFLILRNVQLPDTTADVTCSIKANWVPGSSVGSEVCVQGLQDLTMTGYMGPAGTGYENNPPSLQNWASDEGSPKSPVFDKDPSWESASFTKSWLDLLTPQLDANETGWTTMAATIDSLLSRQQTSNVFTYSSPGYKTLATFQQINIVLASFVLDGMARLGLAENPLDDLDANGACNAASSFCEWYWQSPSRDNIDRDIIADKAKLVPVPRDRSSIGKLYHWQATVAGYGIKNSSTASTLALTVLYAHLCMAVTHIYYTVYTRNSSNSWSSPSDLLTLSRCSTAATGDVLRNTCTGIKAFETRQVRLRIRDDVNASKGCERLQLQVNSNSGLEVKRGKRYGQQP